MHDEIDLDSVGDLSQETKDLVLALKGSPRLLAEETYFACLSAAVEHQHAAI